MLCYGPLVSELGGTRVHGPPNSVIGGGAVHPAPLAPPLMQMMHDKSDEKHQTICSEVRYFEHRSHIDSRCPLEDVN